MKGYLPQALATFLAWFLNFNTKVTANPGLYGLAAADAVAIDAAYTDFAAKYAISTAPATRSPTTVQDTITARNTAVQVIRGYGRLISANAGVADADKVALGLNVRDTVNTPIPAPATNPILGIVGATPGQLTVTFKDSAAAPKVKAKPFGATALQLFASFGTVAPATPAATPFLKLVTKTPFAVDCPAGSAGQTAFLYARWVTAKGLVGPWSPLASSAVI